MEAITHRSSTTGCSKCLKAKFEAIDVLNNHGEGKIKIGKFGRKDLGHVLDTSSFILVPNEIIIKTLDVENMETIGKEELLRCTMMCEQKMLLFKRGEGYRSGATSLSLVKEASSCAQG